MQNQSNRFNLILKKYQAYTIIGCHAWERAIEQPVLISLEIPIPSVKPSVSDPLTKTINYDQLTQAIQTWLKSQSFELIETLTEQLADYLIDLYQLSWILLEIEKPHAVPNASSIGIRLYRTATDPKNS